MSDGTKYREHSARGSDSSRLEAKTQPDTRRQTWGSKVGALPRVHALTPHAATRMARTVPPPLHAARITCE